MADGEKIMAAVVADSIVSPLGLDTAENYSQVKAGHSALCRHEQLWGLPHLVVASLTDRNVVDAAFAAVNSRSEEHYSYFERMAIVSIHQALQRCQVDPQSPRTLLILSTTKGNIDMLRSNEEQLPMSRLLPANSAQAIARQFGFVSEPLVVSNACTSGLCAQIEAMRLIETGAYDYVVVCGVDVQSPFIISGFHSLMALSDEPCRPFDEDRTGINLGEAAATIIYKGIRKEELPSGTWTANCGAIRNDAHHISSPSNTGEGCYRALSYVMKDQQPDDIAFINAHGTATLFNDEMESRAIDRAGLSQVPVNSLKGYYGHTMGAAGVLETILSMRAADDGIILGTRGFSSLGVSKRINVAAEHRTTQKARPFIKMLSGFGGCNAVMLFQSEK